ncbi:MAG: hypothetical protein KKA60_00980 [Proteobacteria bacterium]|nr:hypothetical protein [Pseudomonadota bacterium]
MGDVDLDLAAEAFELWAWAQRGFLPLPGGWQDQAERDLMMMETVWGAFTEWRIRYAS